jgi:uncharacterized membrane protein YdbT with pleckstrin-like domain
MTEPAAATDATLWTGHPSHWHYFWMWFFGILLIPIVVGILMIIWIFVDRARRTYMVTNAKIIFESGLIAKSSNEIRIRDVRSINLAKHGMVGFLGVGDLEFSSSATDKAEIVFSSIAHASDVRDLVRKHQDT